MTIEGKYQERKDNVEFVIVKIDNCYYFSHILNQIMSESINF